MGLRILCAAASLAILLAATGAAATYDETVDGDLSDVPATPTPWTLTSGANTLSGTAGTIFTEEFEAIQDFDLVELTIPAGHQLDTITIDSFTVTDSLAFVGLQPGSPWLDVVGDSMEGTFLVGWALLNDNPDVPDLLSLMLSNVATTTAPLAAGVYTFELQDFNGTFDYALNFNVSAIGGGTPGDFDGMNGVNADDLTQWRGDYGLNGDSDADDDLDSDGNDFLAWQRNLGSPSVASVPEPGSAGLIAWVAGLAFHAARRRRR